MPEAFPPPTDPAAEAILVHSSPVLTFRRRLSRIERWLFWAGICLVLAVGLWQRFSHPLLPLLDPDVGGYLAPALSSLSGNGFIHFQGRHFLYPGFLWVVLRLFDDFRAITIVQHLFGMGAGVLLCLCFARVRALMGNLLPAVCYRWSGLLAAGIYLRLNSALYLEAKMRPEAIFPTFAILNILLTIEFARRRLGRPGTRAALGMGIALVFNTAITVALKPSFGVTTVVALLPVLAFLFDRRESLAGRLALVVASACLVIGLIGIPERALARSDLTAQRFGSETLFVIHANLICAQMAEDLGAGRPGPYDLEWLRARQVDLEREINASKETVKWTSLDFNPDYLMYEASFCRAMQREFAHDPEKLNEFYRYYYLRTLTHHPQAMAAKVMRQMTHFYRFQCPAYESRKFNFADYYRLGSRPVFAFIAQKLSLSQSGQRYLDQMALAQHTKVTASEPRRFRRVVTALAKSYLPILLVFLGALLAILPVRDLRQRFRGSGFWVLLFYGYNFGNCLGVAIFHTLSVRRYNTIQVAFTLFAQGLAALFLLGLAAELVRRWRAARSESISAPRP